MYLEGEDGQLVVAGTENITEQYKKAAAKILIGKIIKFFQSIALT